MPSLIGWAHTQNDPCYCLNPKVTHAVAVQRSLKSESCHDANFLVIGAPKNINKTRESSWCPLLPPTASEVVKMTVSVAASGDKVGIIKPFRCRQWRRSWHHYNSQFSARYHLMWYYVCFLSGFNHSNYCKSPLLQVCTIYLMLVTYVYILFQHIFSEPFYSCASVSGLVCYCP